MEYNKKLIPILEDLENKEIELAGGSVVGMSLATTNSLIKYICNLTIGKKKYEDVQNEIYKISDNAETLKQQALEFIDKDRAVLEDILKAYKIRKEKPNELEKANKYATKFCLEVTQNALETLKLAKEIEGVGNKMLASDFKICKYNAFASFESSIVNIEVNLKAIEDKEFVEEIQNKYNKYYEEAKSLIESN